MVVVLPILPLDAGAPLAAVPAVAVVVAVLAVAGLGGLERGGGLLLGLGLGGGRPLFLFILPLRHRLETYYYFHYLLRSLKKQRPDFFFLV